MEVRRATAADADALRALWEASTAEITFTPYPGTPFQESLLSDHLALVAEDAETVVGAVYANTGADPSYGFVFGLYVRPDHRRHGLARRLMRAVAEMLREEGKQYVVLSVDTPNAAARSLYARLGFVDAARTLRAEIAGLVDDDDHE